MRSEQWVMNNGTTISAKFNFEAAKKPDKAGILDYHLFT
jgi:hypothetical protein